MKNQALTIIIHNKPGSDDEHSNSTRLEILRIGYLHFW